VTGLIQSVYLNAGTPQETVNWSRPDHWIDDILSGDEQVLAQRIWRETDRSVNPRYLKGIHLFLNKHRLLEVRPDGAYTISKQGTDFIQSALSVTARIDNEEGLIALLDMIGKQTSAARLKEQWAAFLSQFARYKSTSSISATLADRLKNLEERALVQKRRSDLFVTEAGSSYLREVRQLSPRSAAYAP
jgi:restriction system protein